MARYRLHLTGWASPCVVEVGAPSTRQLAEDMARQRFLCGLLIEEGGQPIDPPVEVVAPLHQIRLIASA